MNDLDDRTLDQASYAFREIIGQKPLGFPLGVITLYAVSGVPSNAIGNNGDICFRKDGGAGTAIYQKRAAVWVAVA
jgi:hypothetical protein